ncbi:MAG TPA: hypothetical protein VHB21_03225 [Minicystis sp.]|nr:hypothetical protein [Minicystis sp.]
MSLRMQKLMAVGAAAAVAAATLLGAPGVARAQTTASPVSPVGKGTVGGALLGGEVVCLTLAAVGVEKGWPYWVFGGVGAVGGGIGGFVVDKTGNDAKPASAEPSLYMLAGGMVLFIPTLVASLNATSYHPPETESQPVTNEPVAEPPRAVPQTAPGGPAAPGPTTRAPSKSDARIAKARKAYEHMPLSVLDLYDRHLRLGVPAVEVRPLYSQREIAEFGVKQGTEVKFPVFRAVF